jgi:hypothetical protein
MEYLPAWMFLALTIVLMAGFPVTFTLMGTALVFGLIGFGWSFFNLLPLRIWGVMTNETLIAVPLFVFMGVMLERSGLAEDLLDTMGCCSAPCAGAGHIGRGGGHAAGRDHRHRRRHRRHHGPAGGAHHAAPQLRTELATGTVCASGTLGQIIPPSPSCSCSSATSSGFPSATCSWGPCFRDCLLVALYVLYILLIAILNPDSAPAIPAGGAGRHFSKTNEKGEGHEGPGAASCADAFRPGIDFRRHRLADGGSGRGGRRCHLADDRQPKVQPDHSARSDADHRQVDLHGLHHPVRRGRLRTGFSGLGGDGLVREFLGGLAAKYSHKWFWPSSWG